MGFSDMWGEMALGLWSSCVRGSVWPGAAPEVNFVLLQVPPGPSLMHVHLFGAYFGLAVTSQFPEPPPGLDKNRSTPKSELFSVLGESLAASGIAGGAVNAALNAAKHSCFVTVATSQLAQGHSCHTWGSVCSCHPSMRAPPGSHFFLQVVVPLACPGCC